MRLVLEASQRRFNPLEGVLRARGRRHELQREGLLQRLVTCNPHLPHRPGADQSDEDEFVPDRLADVDFLHTRTLPPSRFVCYLGVVAAQTGKRLKTDAGWTGEADSHEFASTVGERIRVARQQKGWTQVELAEAAGLSSNYVARLERGELGASLFVAMRIAEALGIGLDVLAQAQAAARLSATGARTTTKRRVG